MRARTGVGLNTSQWRFSCGCPESGTLDDPRTDAQKTGQKTGVEIGSKQFF